MIQSLLKTLCDDDPPLRVEALYGNIAYSMADGGA